MHHRQRRLNSQNPKGQRHPRQSGVRQTKDDQTSYTPKNYYGKKVWTVNARDVAYDELEHYLTAERIITLQGEVHVLGEELKQENLPLHTTEELLRILHQAKENLRKKKCNTDSNSSPKTIMSESDADYMNWHQNLVPTTHRRVGCCRFK